MTASWFFWFVALGWAQPATPGAAPALLDIEGAGSVPVLVLRAGGPGVFLAACRGVSWERFDVDAAGYVALESLPCDADGPAVLVTEVGLRLPMETAPANGSVVRAVVVVGTGCTAGMPLPVAGCKSVVAVSSGNHTVRGGS